MRGCGRGCGCSHGARAIRPGRKGQSSMHGHEKGKKEKRKKGKKEKRRPDTGAIIGGEIMLRPAPTLISVKLPFVVLVPSDA